MWVTTNAGWSELIPYRAKGFSLTAADHVAAVFFSITSCAREQTHTRPHVHVCKRTGMRYACATRAVNRGNFDNDIGRPPCPPELTKFSRAQNSPPRGRNRENFPLSLSPLSLPFFPVFSFPLSDRTVSRRAEGLHDYVNDNQLDERADEEDDAEDALRNFAVSRIARDLGASVRERSCLLVAHLTARTE